MIIKKLKFVNALILSVLVAVAALVFFVTYNNYLTDINSRKDILNIISYYENKNGMNSFNIDYKSLSDEKIEDLDLNIIENKDFAAIFYKSNNRNNIIVLHKSKLFVSKYNYFGSSSSTDANSLFMFEQKRHGKLTYIVAVNAKNGKDKSGISISKFNSYTNESDSIVKMDFDEVPYYDLFVDEFCCDEGDYIEAEYY